MLATLIVQAEVDIEQLSGRTFAYPGPNCFGVALYASGINPTIRGVDVKEINAILKHQCHEITEPQRGDIGTYSVKNYDIIHAFYHVSENLILEKTGVDYVGPTPIYLREQTISHQIFGVEQNCLRYGGNLETCSNDLKYFRCGELDGVLPDSITRKQIQIETIFEELLAERVEETILNQKKEELGILINEYRELIQSTGQDFEEILQARLISYQKQVQFF